jgi:SRR1
MLEDGWTTVSAKDKKRVMRRSKIQRSHDVTPTSVHQSSLLNSGYTYDGNALCKCIDACMGFIVKTDLFANLCSLLKNWMDNTELAVRVGKLVVYGVGNFSYTKVTYHSASLWQLALALCVKKKVKAFSDFTIKIDFFDPCTTDDERRFLQEQFEIHVMPINDKGHFVADSVDTIFFMPHCPAQLYENVVWSNYHNLRRIVLIGNSLHNLATRPSAELLCLRTLIPNLKETPLIGSPSDYKAAAPIGNFLGAWNDTYLTYFDVQKQAILSRPYDIFNSNNADLELL